MPLISRRAIRVLLPAVVATAACSHANEGPKVPLAQAKAEATQSAQSPSPHDALPENARASLELGNSEFRAGRYDAALKDYRAAATAAPLNPAPYFGIFMVAQKTNNRALADSANASIKRLSNATSVMLTDSTMRSLHTNGVTPATAAKP
ncbi:MAG TPA: hypothetical protein VG818_06690 [Gemmatimonadaceae bacterium]|jgi:hypothetical protein|nr:hypothetical protein [Gemmatimonadaceae bacterium]